MAGLSCCKFGLSVKEVFTDSSLFPFSPSPQPRHLIFMRLLSELNGKVRLSKNLSIFHLEFLFQHIYIKRSTLVGASPSSGLPLFWWHYGFRFAYAHHITITLKPITTGDKEIQYGCVVFVAHVQHAWKNNRREGIFLITSEKFETKYLFQVTLFRFHFFPQLIGEIV